MSMLSQKSKQISLLFEYGVLTTDQVIAWADQQIVELDSTPEALLELSMTDPSKTADFLSLLHRLDCGSDFWLAFRSALPRIRDFVAAHPERAESIASHLYQAPCGNGDLPEDLKFIDVAEDRFDLARSGMMGDFDTVYREFVRDLRNVTGGQ